MAGFLRGASFVLLFSPLFHCVSLRTLILITVCMLVFRFLLHRHFRQRWRVHYGGSVLPGFEKVAEVFRENVRNGQEKGAAFAVYYKGRLVVDLWGGYADHGVIRFRTADSTSVAYSATKAVAAVCLEYLFDRGLLDYNEPVAKYWPEFGQNNKDGITVKTLLCHRAGLLAIRETHKLSLAKDDPAEMGRLLAKQKPFWTPGTAQGYHVLTVGLYADQLVRRIDPKGRSLAAFFQEEIAKPFDIDFAIGEEKEQFHRACRETRADFGLAYFVTRTVPVAARFVANFFYSLFKYKTFYLYNLKGNPTDWKPRILNNPDFREIQCPSSHGVGTARALAKLMGILANGGKLGKDILLSPEAIEHLRTPLSSEFDRVMLRMITYGPGTMLFDIKHDGQKPHRVFGHWGAGGQMTFCDPEQEVGWTYLTNYCSFLHGFIVDHRYAALEKALYQCLTELEKTK